MKGKDATNVPETLSKPVGEDSVTEGVTATFSVSLPSVGVVFFGFSVTSVFAAGASVTRAGATVFAPSPGSLIAGTGFSLVSLGLLSPEDCLVISSVIVESTISCGSVFSTGFLITLSSLRFLCNVLTSSSLTGTLAEPLLHLPSRSSGGGDRK